MREMFDFDVMRIGSQRRSIQNHKELSKALESEFKEDFACVSLEGTSICFQYLLFNRAKVVIAQHGMQECYTVIFFTEN